MAASSDLKKVLSDVWDWHLRDAPEFASATCFHEYDDKLESLSIEANEERHKQCSKFLEALLKIPVTDLTAADKVNYRILKEDLTAMTEGYKWRFHSAFNPVNFIENIPNEFSSWIIDSMKFKTEADYHMYLKRLSAVPTQIDEMIEMMSQAIEKKTTLHRCSVEGVVKQFQELLEKEAEDQVFYVPFKEKLMQRTDLLSSTKNDICRQAVMIIENDLKSGFQKLLDFMQSAYLPNTRETFGVSGLPDGEEYYKACLRWHLSTDMSPKEVHELGLEEVTRIKKGMEAVMKEVKFNGNFQEFLDYLKNDKQFYFETGDELLTEFRKLVHDHIQPKLDAYFQNIPNSKCDIKPMPYPGPGGMYLPPSFDGERSGVFFVNLYYPKTAPTFSMMVLSLHEASPGHHLQGIYALDRGLPLFRRERHYKTYAAPFFMPTYTAYVEGWACYAEYLGIEMGAYRTPYELVGRYSDEMMRAARLVVDTGLHVFGWSREKAVEYMQANTCVPYDEIEEEVNRYMMWPGQACGYKIGEIKIRNLRKAAEQKLGEKFDVKEFHEVILALGPASLQVLEDVINDWVKHKQ